MYFSSKHDIPSDEYGFEQRAREESEIVYPKRMKDMLVGTVRWEKEKTVNISLETSEPCQIMIDIAQNFKDGRIMKRATRAIAVPKFKKGDKEKELDKVHKTPGAKMHVDCLLNIPDPPGREEAATPPPKNPTESTKLKNQKIASLMDNPDEVVRFFSRVNQLKQEQRDAKTERGELMYDAAAENKRRASTSRENKQTDLEKLAEVNLHK